MTRGSPPGIVGHAIHDPRGFDGPRPPKPAGEATGEAKGLLFALDLEGCKVPDRLRDHILACRDLDVLASWYGRVKAARSLADIFDPALLG